MIPEILRQLLRFALLVLLQVVVLNHVYLGTFINPYLYLFFLLGLPVALPRLLLLPIGFLTGLVIDMFQNTPGMHASACLLMMYVRPGWLRIIAPRDGYETDAQPGIRRFGIAWYLAYASMLIFIHHLLLFYIEVFRFSEFLGTMGRVLLSSVVTLLLVIIVQYLVVRPRDSQI